MRLFTHNFLQCHVKGCTQNNFPLSLSEVELEKRETELNAEFIQTFLHKLEWEALLKSISQLGLQVSLPEEKPEELSEEMIETLHTVLFEHYLKNGKMTCEGCGHIYPIKDGIPNMLLADDEV